MKIEKEHADYQIWEMKQYKESMYIRLHWRFRNATDFLIYIYDSRSAFDLENAVQKIKAMGRTDLDIVNGAEEAMLLEPDGSLKAVHVKKEDFMRSGKKFRLPVAGMKQDIPYGISVFACEFDQEEELLHIYRTDMRQNTCFRPVEIKTDIKCKHEWFAKYDCCTICLPRLEEYQDGAILYHVDGINSDFPLPKSCLGKKLVVAVPKGAQVSIRIREEYQKYYKKR